MFWPRTPSAVRKAASSSPTGFCTSMWKAKKTKLFFRAFQNWSDHSGSLNRVRKLSTPTYSPSSSNRLSRSESSSGYTMNSE